MGGCGGWVRWVGERIAAHLPALLVELSSELRLNESEVRGSRVLVTSSSCTSSRYRGW
jgi:hypothetical protein